VALIGAFVVVVALGAVQQPSPAAAASGTWGPSAWGAGTGASAGAGAGVPVQGPGQVAGRWGELCGALEGELAQKTGLPKNSACRSAVEPCQGAAFLDNAIASTAESVEGTPNVLVVSYSTTWCGPCKLMEPKVEQLSETFAGKVSFVSVIGDKDDNDGIQLMKREGVRTVPMYQIYKDGRKVASVSGADPDTLTRSIEQHVQEA